MRHPLFSLPLLLGVLSTPALSAPQASTAARSGSTAGARILSSARIKDGALTRTRRGQATVIRNLPAQRLVRPCPARDRMPKSCQLVVYTLQ